MDQDETRHGVRLGPGHIVLGGDPALTPKGAQLPPPQFSAHVCCGQTTGWIKMPFGMDVGIGPGQIVSDGDPALAQKVHTPTFQPMSIVVKWLDGSRRYLARR